MNIFEEVKEIITHAEHEVDAKLAKAMKEDYQGDENILAKINYLYGEACEIFSAAKTGIKNKWVNVKNSYRYAKHLGYEESINKIECKLRESVEISTKKMLEVEKEYEAKMTRLDEELSDAQSRTEEKISYNERMEVLVRKRQEIIKKINKIHDDTNTKNV